MFSVVDNGVLNLHSNWRLDSILHEFTVNFTVT